MTYAEKLRDPRWQKKRLQIMERDQFTCRDCSNTEKTLHVHHCHYTGGNPWDTPEELLLTVCEDCHEERQIREDAARYDLGLLFALNPKAVMILGAMLRVAIGMKRRGRIVRVEVFDDETGQPV